MKNISRRKKRLAILLLAFLLFSQTNACDRIVKGRYEILSWLSVPSKYYSGKNYVEFNPLDTLSFEIEENKLLQLERNVEEANNYAGEFWKGHIQNHVYHKVKLSHKDVALDAKVKLGGAMKDHVNTDLWTMKVKIKKGVVKNVDRFMLMHPKVRNYSADFICQEFMKYEGMLAPKLELVCVKINNELRGEYLFEESYSYEFLKSNHQAKGIIFEPTQEINLVGDTDDLDDSLYNSQFNAVYPSLERIYEGDFENVNWPFDYEKWGAFYAICDLVNDRHALWTGNIKCFFNSETGLLEPIGREWNIGYNNRPEMLCSDLSSEELVGDKFHEYMFSNEEFVDAYLRALNKMKTKSYLDKFFSEKELLIDNFLSTIYSAYPTHYYTKDYFYRNQEYIEKRLNEGLLE